MFWDATPADKKGYVADPKQGSHHNRGCAVDLSLYALKDGNEIQMPSDYDEMSVRAHRNYRGGTPEQRRLRDLLRREMQAEGFRSFKYEWWHFDYRDCAKYPIMNVPLEEIP
jgi:D-alanyl-D-alanine dipeptidase